MLTIQPSNLAEAPEFYKIERLCHEFPWSLNILQECFRVGYLCHTFKIPCPCEPERMIIIGFMINHIVFDECHLLNINIHPDYQRRGYAQQALNWLKQILKKQDIKTIFLEVRSSNLAAQALYKKLGFETIATRRNYYPIKSGREDAIVMRNLV